MRKKCSNPKVCLQPRNYSMFKHSIYLCKSKNMLHVYKQILNTPKNVNFIRPSFCPCLPACRLHGCGRQSLHISLFRSLSALNSDDSTSSMLCTSNLFASGGTLCMVAAGPNERLPVSLILYLS